ncbi:MAG: metal ABC transporter ATP-binding protein [Ignavibacteriae bacterium HGW-Ignavibacteriae-3]|nr:MAG: metal ABC transporter ATP-binding protein [Ignavibacteriae bacterium HGW-Ignavibacteriae-3]
MNKEIINFTDVSIGYGNTAILTGINISIAENDFIGVVGPNGAGKTTLLKSLLGNIKLLSGRISKDDLRFGYVPQRDTVQPLLPYTVFDVVMMGRYSLSNSFKRISAEDKRVVEESLSYIGMSDVKNKNYNSLSGGQKQRTLIARALAVEPAVLILDEPTNGMDTPSHYSLLELITRLHSEKKLTIFLVSHLLTDVANIVKKIMLIDKNYFQFGDIGEILSEENLQRTYSSDFHISEIDGEYIIIPKHTKIL